MKPFNPNLPCQTRDKRKVRILCTDAAGDQPICGHIGGSESVSRWCENGSFYTPTVKSDSDLINIPAEPRFREYSESDCPLMAWVRLKNQNASQFIITGKTTLGFYEGGSGFVDYGYALKNREISTDNGKTWLHCGVEINEDV